MRENKRKCLRCGSSPTNDPEIKLFRFPKPGSTNISRCELWAKYCFPDGEWSSVNFQAKLHAEHRMLCHQHIKKSAFVDFSSKKLRRFASPGVEDVSMPLLAVDHVTNDPSTSSVDLPGPSGININTQDTIDKTEDRAYMKCKKYIRKICLLKKQLKYMKNKNYLQELSNSDAVSKLCKKISPTFALLLQGEIRILKKSGMGRRWTSEDKH